MNSAFPEKNLSSGQLGKAERSIRVPRYFIFTEIELLSLIFCVALDIVEYIAAVLMLPLAGDLFDVVGILGSVVLFRWVGLVTLVELAPYADAFPTFIVTWLLWYFLKKNKKTS